MLTKRSIASVILFSILTCGIYMLWWTYVTCTALQEQGGKKQIPPVLTTVLMILFYKVGGVLLALDADDNVNAIKEKHGMTKTDNKVLWLILGIFVPIATVALIQYEINGMINTDMQRRGTIEV